jgi:hypothetical protein
LQAWSSGWCGLMGSPARRAWTLGTLERSRPYLLWFSVESNRWEVQDVGAGEGQGPGSACAEDPRPALRLVPGRG